MLLVSDSQSNLIDLSHRTQAIIARLNKKLASKDVELVVTGQPRIRSDQGAAMEDADLLVGSLDLDGLADQCERHGVAVVSKLTR